ncbi:NINE protein [Haloarcula nitratireducens]|uniref:NINE protein n=1 Tax=Haloarcula nitratireducens TaxID=2487749 RepID=A0AAW4PCW2_9EURY|nr:NINE protein [Halomicroarcula nitratireducens]MBX0295567.1 NINE protein [Halomicroarcula nitratireducens]
MPPRDDETDDDRPSDGRGSDEDDPFDSPGDEMAEYDADTDSDTDADTDSDADADASAVGETAEPGEKYCRSCGTVIDASANFCPDCGASQGGVGASATTAATSEKDRVTAGIFALLLGSFGVHHFYLGNTTFGVLYLCLFWTGLPGIAGIVEGIIYLTKTDEEFQRQYVDRD